MSSKKENSVAIPQRWWWGPMKRKEQLLVNDTSDSVNLPSSDKTPGEKSLALTLDKPELHSEKLSAALLLWLAQTTVENPSFPPPTQRPPHQPDALRSVPPAAPVWTLKPATRSGSSERVWKDASYQPLFVLQLKETAATSCEHTSYCGRIGVQAKNNLPPRGKKKKKKTTKKKMLCWDPAEIIAAGLFFCIFFSCCYNEAVFRQSGCLVQWNKSIK